MHRFLGPLTAVTVASLALPAHAAADAQVRVFHAVPGAGEAVLTVGASPALEPAGFGAASRRGAVTVGDAPWRLEVAGKVVATGSTRVEDDRDYTAVVFAAERGPMVSFFPDARRAAGSKARLRAIHAAPELGAPDLVVDGATAVPRFAFRRATPYLAVAAGSHSVKAVRSGTRKEVLSVDDLSLKPGTATTAVVVGTQGEATRVVALQDVKTPASKARMRKVRTASSSPARAASAARHAVEDGESLWSIARGSLGAGANEAAVAKRVVAIWDANEATIGTGDPDLIHPGTVLRVG